ncbi:cyclic nucleotide-gated channel alpha 1a [Anaeramoeba flamelloides]|uniref:Cyclic nucleotide-gated channel alpha 1a n=1 Tax=Anaeramoeba flamelloides TaxID=1746091 RepID=A0ABQ8YP23_9EUKA|nr:cyclic nucleotide-gated channel alpha 1a [Anaeramoeba flamelloides]
MHNNKYCNIVKQKQITNKKGKQKEKEKEMKKEKEQEKVKEKEKETINKKTNDLQEGVNLIDHVLDPDTIRLTLHWQLDRVTAELSDKGTQQG